MVLAPILLAGCVEYTFEAPRFPDLAVSPAALTRTGACDSEPATLTVTNEGAAALTLLSIVVEGGVDLTAPALPLVLEPGEALPLAFTIEPGAGLVIFTSDDPVHPLVTVPITADANIHPVAIILSPYEDQWIPPDGDFVLSGVVSDTEDGPAALALEWQSSLAGTVGAPVAEPDGTVRTEWPAEQRVSGPQTIALRATDACGAVGEATLFYCQEGPFTFDALVSDAWLVASAAVVDATAGLLTLGDAAGPAVGAGFDAFALVNADSVEASFDVRITGDVTGFSLTALDADAGSAWIGGSGCGLGFGGGVACTGGPALPGWSLAFPSAMWEAPGCVDGPLAAFTFDGDLSTWAACAATPSLADGAWHTVAVSVDAPRLSVSIDGVSVLAEDLDATWAFPAYLGFTATTGGPGTVEIGALSITDRRCE
ncbi:MAG: hypothetical protein Q8P18_03150 [Pseudomonadota bacterium]|nr:hypothetical protein [Pseudomonadota bacterium]